MSVYLGFCILLFGSVADFLQQESWSLVEEARIGAADGPSALTPVGAVAVDGEGRLFVAEPMEALVRVFDADGALRDVLGRRGGGPGEFQAPVRLGWVGDTLWVNDVPARRVSLWRGGQSVGSFPWPTPEVDPGFSPPSVGSVLADGALLVAVMPLPIGADHDDSALGSILRTDRTGSGLDKVSDIRVPQPLVLERGGRRVVTSFKPFEDGTLVAVSPDGKRVVVVDREVASSGRQASFGVTALDARGDTVFHRGIDYHPQRLTDDVVDAALEGPVSRLMRRYPSRAAAEEAIRESVFLPSFQPPVTDLLVGRDHTAWLRREHPPSGSAEWWVVDEAGKVIGRVAIPVEAEVVAADRSHVWTVENDDLDVPYIIRYAVER